LAAMGKQVDLAGGGRKVTLLDQKAQLEKKVVGLLKKLFGKR